MEESENAFKEPAEAATEKKAGPKKLLMGLIVTAVIVFGLLWLIGVFSSDKAQKTPQVQIKKDKPAMHTKKITQPIKMPEPAPGPAKEASPPSDEEIAPKEDKVPVPEEKPAKSVEKPEQVPVAQVPSPSPPHHVLKTDADIPPAPMVSHPYSLHMGSYEHLEATEKFMAELAKKGLSPYWTRVDLGTKGIWYRVFVGQFETEVKANEFQKRLGIKADRVLKTANAVQVGIYTSKEALEQGISSVKKTGYCPYAIDQPQHQYQLLIGAFQTRKAAEKLAAKLQASGLPCETVLR